MSVAGATLNETYLSVPESVPIARTALVELAQEGGASEEQLDSIRLAASEALSNAVLHAYPDGPGPIYVTGAVFSDEFWVLVTDDGCGLHAQASGAGLGLGLLLIAEVTNDFSLLNRSSGGTEVRMRFSLEPVQRPPRDQSRGSVNSPVRPASDRFSTTT